MNMYRNEPHGWFTAGEIADLAKAKGVWEVPHTKSGMIKWIKRRMVEDQGFADDLALLSRKRPGKEGGGGTEYGYVLFKRAGLRGTARALIAESRRRGVSDAEAMAEDDPACYLTIRQIAGIAKAAGMKDVTMAAWGRRAKQEGWKALGPNIYRVVEGEPAYHVSVLSGRMRKLARPKVPDTGAVKAPRHQDMQAARARILDAIAGRAKAEDRSWRQVMYDFVASVEEAAGESLPPQYRRIKGFDLPYTIVREAKGWTESAQSWRVSRRSLYAWNEDVGREHKLPRRERTSGAPKTFEKGYRAAQEFIWQAPDAVLESLVASDIVRFIAVLKRRGYEVTPVQS